MYLVLVFHPSGGGLLNEGMHVWVSRTEGRHGEGEEVAGNGPRYLFFFRSSADEFFSNIKRCILQMNLT